MKITMGATSFVPAMITMTSAMIIMMAAMPAVMGFMFIGMLMAAMPVQHFRTRFMAQQSFNTLFHILDTIRHKILAPI
jgi:hypothetical protein